MAFTLLSMFVILKGLLMPKPCCLAFEGLLDKLPAFFCKVSIVTAYDSTLFCSW